jgi:molecular chaperone GrpE
MSNNKTDPPDDMDPKEIWDKYLRSLAEQENERKRHRQELRAAREEGVTSALREVLPVVDEVQRGLDAAQSAKGRGSLNKIREGLGHTQRSVTQTLMNIGVEGFDSTNQEFDPSRMEAISRVSNPELTAGTVAGEIERGYLKGGKLLRPARVAVVVDDDQEEDKAS